MAETWGLHGPSLPCVVYTKNPFVLMAALGTAVIPTL